MKQKNGSGQERQVELSPRCIHDRVCRSSAEHCDCRDIKCPEYRSRQAQEEERERVLNMAITEFETRCRNVVESGMDPKMFQRTFDMADGMQEAIIYLKELRDKEKKEGPDSIDTATEWLFEQFKERTAGLYRFGDNEDTDWWIERIGYLRTDKGKAELKKKIDGGSA